MYKLLDDSERALKLKRNFEENGNSELHLQISLWAFVQSSRNFACVVGAVSVGTVCHSETVDIVMWKLMQAESTGVQIF